MHDSRTLPATEGAVVYNHLVREEVGKQAYARRCTADAHPVLDMGSAWDPKAENAVEHIIS